MLLSINSIDKRFLLSLQRVRTQPLNWFFKFLTYSGTSPVWWMTALLLKALNFYGVQLIENQNQLLRALFSPLLAWILGSGIKKIISRERPSEKISGYICLITSPTCRSFPSTHAASTFSFYFALYYFQHPIAPLIGVWALLVSFSRLYLGVHYLSDVLGGIFLGLLCAWGVFSFL